jgi:CDP-diacylglycerol--serine O-phosphatidyltransferase
VVVHADRAECVALRLARFNLGGDSHDDTGEFQGLPSPAAGLTLATYYPFTQTDFYQIQLATLPWSQILVFLIIALGLAMVSTIRYARLPRIGFRSLRGITGLAINLTIVAFGIWSRDIFFFPLGLAYLTYGMGRAVVVGLLDRAELDEESGDAPAEPDLRPIGRIDRRA